MRILFLTLSFGIFFSLASAQAAQAGSGADTTYSHAQTLGHCGWVPVKPRNFMHDARNVRIVQSKLESLGYDIGASGADGRLGRNTRRAITRFQREHNLRADGTAGGKTVTLLAYASHPLTNVRRCHRPYVTVLR